MRIKVIKPKKDAAPKRLITVEMNIGFAAQTSKSEHPPVKAFSCQAVSPTVGI